MIECMIGILVGAAAIIGGVFLLAWRYGNPDNDDVIAGPYRTHDGRVLPPLHGPALPTTRITTYTVTERDERGRLVERRYKSPPDDPSIHQSPYAR